MSATNHPAPVGVPKNLFAKPGAPVPDPDPAQAQAQAQAQATVTEFAESVAQMVPAQALKPKKAKAQAQAQPAPVPVNVVPGHPGYSDPAQIPQTPQTPQTPGVPLLGKAGTAFPVTLPLDLLAKVMKPVVGMGGWQRLMLDLQAVTVINQPAEDGQGGFYQTGTMTLTPHLLTKLIALSVKHGSGGYQAVIRHVVCLALNQHKAAILGGA